MNALEKYKSDIIDIITYAINEYTDSHLSRKYAKNIDKQSLCFGNLTVDIANITVEKNRINLQYYNVKDNTNRIVCSYFIGNMAILFARSSSDYRKKLLKEKKIQGIITLKQKTFDHYVLPACIVLFGEKESEIWLSSAESINQIIQLFMGDSRDEQNVYYTNKLSAENFLPEYYNDDKRFIEENLKGSIVKELCEVADVISGKSIRRDSYCNRGIPFLRGRDIRDGKLVKPDVYISRNEVNKYARQLLQVGDILLTKHFAQNKIAIVTENDIPAIASNMLFIIRPYGVSEKYLYNYLTSKTGKEVFNKQINRLQRGTIIPTIALSDLMHIKVPVFDENTMQFIDCLNIDSKEELVNAKRRILNNTFVSEKEYIPLLLEQLVSNGWKRDDFIVNSTLVSVKDLKTKWHPDIVYHNKDVLVVIEVIQSLTSIKKAKLIEIDQILQNEEYFVILATGLYFEVHKSGVSESYKTINPPSLDEIINWEKEVK